MSVYVDYSKHAYRSMKMCHMLADTPQELVDMVDAIGVHRKWFQDNASVPHFDICQSKRALAVANGAIEVDRRTFCDLMKRIRATWPVECGKWKL
jgi:hypothetical protein